MSALVAAARAYLDVPFVHQGRTRAGLDCAGLALLAYRDCGVVLPDLKAYGREPFNDGLVGAITRALGDPIAVAPVRTRQLQAGDVIVVRYDINPHHVAIVSDYLHGGLAVIHCDGHTKRVIEHRLAPDMVARITHAYRKPT